MNKVAKTGGERPLRASPVENPPQDGEFLKPRETCQICPLIHFLSLPDNTDYYYLVAALLPLRLHKIPYLNISRSTPSAAKRT